MKGPVYDAAGRQICGAKTRATGQPCKRAPVPGSNRCKLHGGKSLGGVASPHFKHGRYSKHLPARLAARFGEAIADDDLLNLSSEIALLDALISDAVQKLDSSETGALWQTLRKAHNELEAARIKTDAQSMAYWLNEIGELIKRGAAEHDKRSEIVALLKSRAGLVDQERRRREAMENYITAEQAMVLVAGLLSSVKDNVTDRAALNAIQAEFIRLTGVANHQRISAGGGDSFSE